MADESADPGDGYPHHIAGGPQPIPDIPWRQRAVIAGLAAVVLVLVAISASRGEGVLSVLFPVDQLDSNCDDVFYEAGGSADSATIVFTQSNGTRETLENQRLPWTSDGAAGSQKCFDPLDPAELTVQNDGRTGSVSCRIVRADELVSSVATEPPGSSAVCLD